MIRVYFIQTETQNVSSSRLEARIRAYADELPPARRDRILRIQPLQTQVNSTLGWQLLKGALHNCGYPDFTLSQLLFDADRKPRWPNRDCDFNLSHSHSLIALALTQTGRVGIDSELIRPVRSAPLLRRILSPRENPPANADNQAFFRFWTQKEAVIKAEGNGGVWDMHGVDLDGLTADYKNSRWYLYPLQLAAGYITHVASDVRDPFINVHKIAIEQLLEPETFRDKPPKVV